MTTRPANVPTETQAFVAWESRRKARSELIGGAVRLMVGGSRAHDVVAGNLLAALPVLAHFDADKILELVPHPLAPCHARAGCPTDRSGRGRLFRLTNGAGGRRADTQA